MPTGPRTPTTSTGRRFPTTGDCSPWRQSATAIACSTSDAAPVRPPCSRPERRGTGRRWAWTCRRTCSRIARRRAAEEGIENASFEQADAQIHPFKSGGFDVAISNTGATFFGDLVAGLANIGRALRPSGRLALLTWRPLPNNEWVREFTGALAAGRDIPAPPPDAPSPFALSDPDRVRSILTSAGFTDMELEGIDEGMWFGTHADDAYRFVLGLLGWMLEGLDDNGRARALDALRSTIATHETADGVIFDSAVWVIRATRP